MGGYTWGAPTPPPGSPYSPVPVTQLELLAKNLASLTAPPGQQALSLQGVGAVNVGSLHHAQHTQHTQHTLNLTGLHHLHHGNLFFFILTLFSFLFPFISHFIHFFKFMDQLDRVTKLYVKAMNQPDHMTRFLPYQHF